MKIQTLETITKDENGNIIETQTTTILIPDKGKGILSKKDNVIVKDDGAIYLGTEDSISNYEDIELENNENN